MQEISADVFVSDQTNDYVTLDSEVMDPDEISESVMYEWSCFDVTMDPVIQI